MDRINGADYVDIGGGKRGFRAEDLPTGVSGTEVTAEFLNAVQEELLALIEAAGFDANDGDWKQLAKAVQSQRLNYAVAAGTANALTAALNPAPTALRAGLVVNLKLIATNTGAATLNLNGLGAVSITRQDGSAAQQADLPSGSMAGLLYDGTAFRIIGVSSVASPPRNLQIWSVAGTYTFVVPDGVYKIFSTCIGGGGGAGGIGVGTNGQPFPGGGGGAGATVKGWLSVTPGQQIPIIVGAGGAGGNASATNAAGSYGASGSTGGTSSVGSSMSATGGGGGGATTAGTSGGLGGTTFGGQIGQIGGNGTDGSGATASPIYGGNGGASSQGGGGRSSTVYSATIQNGRAPGSGGGSVYAVWYANGAGGKGADGLVTFEY